MLEVLRLELLKEEKETILVECKILNKEILCKMADETDNYFSSESIALNLKDLRAGKDLIRRVPRRYIDKLKNAIVEFNQDATRLFGRNIVDEFKSITLSSEGKNEVAEITTLFGTVNVYYNGDSICLFDTELGIEYSTAKGETSDVIIKAWLFDKVTEDTKYQLEQDKEEQEETGVFWCLSI